LSSDMRDVELAAEKGEQRAAIALELLNYGIRKYIGAYAAVMGGVDAIVFTAGIGENAPELREQVLENMEYMGVRVDREKNKVRGKETDVSAVDSKVRILVIPTNEELVIARDTLEIVNAAKNA